MIPTSIIFEGVDRLGKDTLIRGVKEKLGYFQELHYQKPEILAKYYDDEIAKLNFIAGLQTDNPIAKSHAQQRYQQESFTTMLHLLSTERRFILNRAHLGETVYAPRYRGYSGDYVYGIEDTLLDRGFTFHQRTLLVLLHTSDFSFITDDGESFDFSKKEEEQNDFLRAFERSKIIRKVAIDVNADGRFVDKEKVLDVVIQAFTRADEMQPPVWYAAWSRNGNDLTRHDFLQADPKKALA